MLVSALLKIKGGDVATIEPEMLISDAVSVLFEERVGALVVSEDGMLVNGILSERDVVRSLATKGCDLMDQPVKTIMTANVIYCTKDDLVSDLMRLMTEHRIRHLPVVESGVLCGIVSIGDVVKNRVEELQTEADAMREYIASS